MIRRLNVATNQLTTVIGKDGTAGSSNLRLKTPWGVAVANGDICESLTKIARCSKLSSKTGFSSKLPEHLGTHAASSLQTERFTLCAAAVADIADSFNHAVRKLASNGNTLTPVAGTGEALAALTKGVLLLRAQAVHS